MTETAPQSTTEARAKLGAELDRLLGEQRRRVRGRFLLHGLAQAVALPAAALLLFFALDHSLRLPAAIRVFHTLVTASLLAFGLWRFVRYPLSRPLATVDTALLLERTFPELHQRLVSAVQLKAVGDESLRNQSRAMIEALLAETAAIAQKLPLERLFDTRRTQRVAGAAALLLALLLGGALAAPATARAFVLRHLGLDVGYPRATRLAIELPPAGPELQRTDSGGHTELVLPAGADLHVSVHAAGVVPGEVLLDVTTAAGETRSIATTPRPGDRFRHVFRRLSAGFEFYARGGDDERGDRTVIVRTIHPPQVANIKAELRPPAYTGREPTVQSGGAIEALTGTEVTLAVATTAAVRAAALVFLESGKRLDLAPVTVQDDSGTSTAYTARLLVETSDRYQVELVGEGGLRNPNPGTYPIAALQDYAPVGHWVLPDDETATMLLPAAILCVRVEGHDDFGLAAADLAVEAIGGRAAQRSFLAAADATAPADPALPPGAAPPSKRPQALVHTELLEVKDLLGGQKTGSEGLSLQFELRDNRAPEAQTTRLPRRQVQIVDEQQLAGAIARLFRSLREEAEQARDLQADRAARIEELAAKPLRPGAETSQVLAGVEVGQGRILAASQRLHDGLMRAFDLHLWNRREPSQNAAKVPELYLAWHREHRDDVARSPAFYRDLAARRAAGTLGAMETTLDPILAMVGLADELATARSPAIARLLAEAQVARDGAELTELCLRTVQVQQRIQKILDELLARLDEWNDYQDLIQETRALRDRQRDVQSRTEEARGKK